MPEKKRSPSLHISANHLRIVLTEVLTDYEITNRELDELVISILRVGKGQSLSHRSITVSNDKLVRKTNQVKAIAQSDAGLFSSMLAMKRKQLKHRGQLNITVGDKDWLMIKDICSLATEFVNEFGLDKRNGYARYIELALIKMKNYSLNKFKYLHAPVCKEYESLREIELDDKPQATEDMEKIYLSFVSERTGFAKSYKKDNPEKYSYFIQARKEADKYNVSPKVYLASQFLAFESWNQIPDPLQLVGTKSIERLQKYCFQHNIKMGASAKGKLVDWAKIKNSNA